MCGLVAVVRRPPSGAPPAVASLLRTLDAATASLADPDAGRDPAAVERVAGAVRELAVALRGPLAAGALIADPVAAAGLERRADEIAAQLAAIEARLDADADAAPDDDASAARSDAAR